MTASLKPEGDGAITDGGEVFDGIRRIILAGDEGLDVAWGCVNGPGDEVRCGALLGLGGGLTIVDQRGVLLPGGEQGVLMLAGGEEDQQGRAEQTGKHAEQEGGSMRGKAVGNTHETGDFLDGSAHFAGQEFFDELAFQLGDDVVLSGELTQRLMMLDKAESTGFRVLLDGADAAFGAAQLREHLRLGEEIIRSGELARVGIRFGLKPGVEKFRGSRFAIHTLGGGQQAEGDGGTVFIKQGIEAAGEAVEFSGLPEPLERRKVSMNSFFTRSSQCCFTPM